MIAARVPEKGLIRIILQADRFYSPQLRIGKKGSRSLDSRQNGLTGMQNLIVPVAAPPKPITSRAPA
jgi:hypothetical protein